MLPTDFYIGLALLAPIFVVIHELAHALAAILLRMHLFGIRIGIGPVVRSFRVCDVRIELHAIPFEGITRAGCSGTTHVRTRWFLMVAAGPMSHCVFFGLAAVWLVRNGFADYLPPEPRNGFATFVWLVAAVNLLLLALSLLPYTFLSGVSPTASDGLQLWRTLVGGKAQIDVIRSGCFLAGAIERHNLKDDEGALQWYEHGLKEYPENFTLLFGRAAMLLQVRHFQAARQLFKSLHERPDLTPAVYAELDDGIASAIIYGVLANDPAVVGTAETPEAAETSRTGLLAEAEKHCRVASENSKTLPRRRRASHEATYAAVMILQGRYSEGLRTIKHEYWNLNSPREKCVSRCFAAIALARLGKLAKAKKCWKIGRKLSPDFFGLEIVEKELSRQKGPA